MDLVLSAKTSIKCSIIPLIRGNEKIHKDFKLIKKINFEDQILNGENGARTRKEQQDDNRPIAIRFNRTIDFWRCLSTLNYKHRVDEQLDFNNILLPQLRQNAHKDFVSKFLEQMKDARKTLEPLREVLLFDTDDDLNNAASYIITHIGQNYKNMYIDELVDQLLNAELHKWRSLYQDLITAGIITP